MTKTISRPLACGGKRAVSIDPETAAVIDFWAKELPPMICRKRVNYFLGGVVSKNVLSKNDCEGKGPKGAFRVGRDMVYPTRELLAWLAETRGIQVINSVRTLDGLLIPAGTALRRQTASHRG